VIRNFSGDCIHFRWIWCFNIRHCAVQNSRLACIRILGYDGLIADNWILAGRQGGIVADRFSASTNIVGNRIDAGGILLDSSNNYVISGNFFDSSRGPAIALRDVHTFTVTGNLMRRSASEPQDEEMQRCHFHVDGARGLVATANTMKTWHEDNEPDGERFPRYGIVLRRLQDSIVKDNVLFEGAVKQLLVDLGDHGDNVIIRDNLGSLSHA
jgi:parallel beta-helix repeat protein